MRNLGKLIIKLAEELLEELPKELLDELSKGILKNFRTPELKKLLK